MLRVLAVSVVLSPLVLLELILRLTVPPPEITEAEDPYVAFRGVRPLFVPAGDGSLRETAPERLPFFRRQTFAMPKPKGTFRVFCLGGSTVQGRPFAVETAFSTWLETDLRAAAPERSWEVVNCGGVSYASYRLRPIFREILDCEPDLVVLYTGHNEFLEKRTYQRVRSLPRPVLAAHRQALGLRLYSLGYKALAGRKTGDGRPAGATVLPTEVDAVLDRRDGLADYRRDDAERVAVVAHFRHNLEAMVAAARARGVPVILLNPVANLKDSPPFKSQSRDGISEADTRRIADLREAAARLPWQDVGGKLDLLRQAEAVDGRDAGLLYTLGICARKAAADDAAKGYFVRAKDEDACPLRILEPMHEVIADVARKERVPLVDVRALIEARTPGGIPGSEWLLDHVHPTIEGHQLIAEALTGTMISLGMVAPQPGFETRRPEYRQEHLASLNPAYFAHGAARLKRLEEWSRGRIPLPPGETAGTPEEARGLP